MKIGFYFLLTVLISSPVFAQSEDLMLLNRNAFQGSSQIVFTKNQGNTTIIGTPFLHEGWSFGAVTTEAGTTFENILMKYDAFNELLGILHESDSLYLRPEFVQSFAYDMNGQSFEFKNGFIIPNLLVNQNKYLQVIHEGNWSVYKDVRKVFKQGSQKQSSYDSGAIVASTFQEVTRYLVKTPEGDWKEVKARRRAVNRLFGEQSKQVADFAKQNKLKYNNDLHLGRIFEFASGLN